MNYFGNSCHSTPVKMIISNMLKSSAFMSYLFLFILLVV